MKILKLLFLCIVFVGTSCEEYLHEPYVTEYLFFQNNSTETIYLIHKQFGKYGASDTIFLTPNEINKTTFYDSSLVWLNHNKFTTLINDIEILVPNKIDATEHFQTQISNANNWTKTYDSGNHFGKKVTVIQHNFFFTANKLYNIN